MARASPGVIDVTVHYFDINERVVHPGNERLDHCLVRLGIEEGGAGHRDGGHTLTGDEDCDMRRCDVQLDGEQPAELGAFCWSGPHEGHVGIVL